MKTVRILFLSLCLGFIGCRSPELPPQAYSNVSLANGIIELSNINPSEQEIDDFLVGKKVEKLDFIKKKYENWQTILSTYDSINEEE